MCICVCVHNIVSIIIATGVVSDEARRRCGRQWQQEDALEEVLCQSQSSFVNTVTCTPVFHISNLPYRISIPHL